MRTFDHFHKLENGFSRVEQARALLPDHPTSAPSRVASQSFPPNAPEPHCQAAASPYQRHESNHRERFSDVSSRGVDRASRDHPTPNLNRESDTLVTVVTRAGPSTILPKSYYWWCVTCVPECSAHLILHISLKPLKRIKPVNEDIDVTHTMRLASCEFCMTLGFRKDPRLQPDVILG